MKRIKLISVFLFVLFAAVSATATNKVNEKKQITNKSLSGNTEAIPSLADCKKLNKILASFSFDRMMGSLNKSRSELTSQQCYGMLAQYTFDSERRKTAEYLLPKMKDFDKLVDISASFSFDSERTKALRALDRSSLALTSAQCFQILKQFSFDGERRATAELFLPRMKDTEKLTDIFALFTFDSERTKALKALSRTSQVLTSAQCFEILKQFSFDGERRATAELFLPQMKDTEKLTDIFALFTFDSERTKTLKGLDKSALSLTSAQCLKILNQYTFDSERYIAAEQLLPCLRDKKDLGKVISLFTFDNERAKMVKLLTQR